MYKTEPLVSAAKPDVKHLIERLASAYLLISMVICLTWMSIEFFSSYRMVFLQKESVWALHTASFTKFALHAGWVIFPFLYWLLVKRIRQEVMPHYISNSNEESLIERSMERVSSNTLVS